jgi:hypothetical protein
MVASHIFLPLQVRYICDPDTMHMMGAYQETATCTYQVVVHTSLLCTHSAFKKENVQPNLIACVPKQKKENLKPVALQRIEAARAQELAEMKAREAEEARVRAEQQAKRGNRIIPKSPSATATLGAGGAVLGSVAGGAGGGDTKFGTAAASVPQASAASSVEMFKRLLRSGGCLSGGTGWWQVEYCHGKLVQQVHRKQDGSKDSVLLGSFDLNHHAKLHKAALRGKTTKPLKYPTVSHYYKDGDRCDETGKRRKAKVKFYCTEQSKSLATVTLALEETKTCECVRSFSGHPERLRAAARTRSCRACPCSVRVRAVSICEGVHAQCHRVVSWFSSVLAPFRLARHFNEAF